MIFQDVSYGSNIHSSLWSIFRKTKAERTFLFRLKLCKPEILKLLQNSILKFIFHPQDASLWVSGSGIKIFDFPKNLQNYSQGV